MWAVESVEQYRLLSDCAATRELKINVLLRVTSGNQFGLDESDIEMIIKNRESHPYNVHTGPAVLYRYTEEKV